ncbi:hypothetical protein [Streptomyces sp. HGB0020]|uniref:hypothetical protein n=1 Tax=Streptomyces sp. HGB0020 TaxID=1078086 RepID=UPI00034EC281|nr:hypothetical protein [Streptomyces sp. HGB0020]EPD63185.1 hypothetical protein HMPREF1211_03526 [Streptomyces sp. HGB0020]
MAQDSWPSPAHNDRAVNDTEYEKIAGRFSDDGVWGNPGSGPVVEAGAGLTVTIKAGKTASVRGHAWTSGTTDSTLPVSANASGSTRNDWVILRLDRSTWDVTAVVKEGTPGSGLPELDISEGSTGVYEIPLATVTLLSGASSVTVQRAELYIGARTRPCTSTTRNPNPRSGEMCYETDTGRVRLWTGSTWRILSSDSGEIIVNSPLSAWTNEVDCVLQERNGSVHLRLGSWQRKAGTLAAADESRLPVLIPADYRHPTRDQYGLCYVTGVEIGRFIIYSKASDRAGQIWLTNKPTISTGDNVLPASGLDWVV